MKLNTLKDMEGSDEEIGVNEHVIGVDELRQEAIKWLKDIENRDDTPFRVGAYEEIKFKNNYELDFLVNWIKHFFNITDEDLK